MVRANREQLLQALSDYQLIHGWFRIDLEQILNAWLKCLEPEETESQDRV